MKPYVGLTVQYYPRVEDEGAKQDGQPLAAIVAAVWSDACVNLTVFDGNGRPYSNPNTSVTLYPHAALKDGHESGCAYMLPANGMLESEIERLEAESDRLSLANQELGSKLVLSQRENVEIRRANDKTADSLAMVCETLGGDRCDDAPTVAESAKGKIENLEAKNAGLIMENCRLIKENKIMETLLKDICAICRAGGLEYSPDAVRVLIERLNLTYAVLPESGQQTGVSSTPIDTRSLESPAKYRAHAKVMRSYDYNHFEISLSCDDLQGLDEVDDLRKDAARLAEKAVDQYQKQQAFETWKINNRRPDNLSREAQEIIGNRPESEWTPAEKAKVKRYRDRQYWINRVYDYEDEFDWESEREEDEIPV